MVIIDSVSIGNETRDIYDSGAARKVSSATNGHLAGLDSNGNLTDSGVASSRQTPASGGTTLSLVNTGDMHNWNNKVDGINVEMVGTATASAIRHQQIKWSDIGSVTQTQLIERSLYMETTATLSTSTTTQVTFTQNKVYINENSVIEVFAGRASGDSTTGQNTFPYSHIYTYTSGDNGYCTITFPKADSAISIKVRIYVNYE